MSKFKVGETIRKKFDKSWHDGKISSKAGQIENLYLMADRPNS